MGRCRSQTAELTDRTAAKVTFRGFPTSQDALSRASRINVILAQWQREVAGESTNTPLRIVDLLAANPFITATGIAGELGVAFTTAQRAIGRLERVGILKRATDAKRDRVHCAQALLDIG